MVSVSLCGQVRMRAGKLFIRNPDGVFEVRAGRQQFKLLLLEMVEESKKIIIGGTMRTHRNGSYIDLQTFQLTDGHPNPTDHLDTLLQVSLNAQHN